jgi:hypothetical protein
MIDNQPMPRRDCFGGKLHRLAMTRRDFLNAVAPNEMIGKVALSGVL